MAKTNDLKSQAGFITLDYIFAMTLILGLTVVLFSLAITLTTVEVAQYMTFATARTYSAAHLDYGSQVDLAQRKYAQLRNNSVLAPLFDNGWFTISPADSSIFRGSPNTEADEYNEHSPGNRRLFHGVSIRFTAHILDFEIPMFGSTTGGNSKSKGFSTNIGSYLSREVTQKQCVFFNDKRWKRIKQLPGANYKEADKYTRGLVRISDNGC